MNAPPRPAALQVRYRRTAARLFGIRSEDYIVDDKMPARLLAGDLMDQGHDLGDATLAACDVFPDADRDEVETMLRDSRR